MGSPGAGKGSLSRLCVQRLGWEQLSTGILCRKHISEGTEIGQRIDFAIKSGKLVSDVLIIEMVEKWLAQRVPSAKGIILDGFPRTVEQARALDNLLASKFTNYSLRPVRLSVSDDTIIKRLSARFMCQNRDCQAVYSLLEESKLAPKNDMVCDYCSDKLARRSDDEPEMIRKRLKTHYMHEQLLFDFYKAQGYTIDELDVEKPLEDVFNDFKKLI